MINQLTENAIINGIHNGDEIFIRQLYDLYYRPLCYFSIHLIGDKQEAEDIAADSFLKWLKKKKDFNNLPDIKSFLFTVLRNACFDYLRKNKTRARYASEISHLSPAGEALAETEMIRAKTLQLIYAEAESLPRQCKIVFKSFFLEGKGTEEIAEQMGTSRQTVLNQKNKAILLLRLKLQEQDLYPSIIFVSSLLTLAAKNY